MNANTEFRAFAFALLVHAATNTQAQAEAWTLREGQHPQAVVTEDGKKTQLLLFLPRNYTGRKWPLIVFLHGRGQVGNDVQVLRQSGIPKLVETQPEFPFIVASPQVPPDQLGWSSAGFGRVIDELLRNAPIDPDRIYLTGLSMGGTETWNIASEHAQRFAAIAPISSKGDSGDTCRLKRVPVWAFHNERDKLSPVSGVQQTVERLRACGGTAELTIYPRDGHNAWTETYANGALYQWFLSHSRSTVVSK